MKNNFLKASLLGISLLVFTAFTLMQPKTRKIPAAEIKTLEGKTVNTAQISNDGKPMVINFWATWCGPCKKELNEIAEVYAQWQKETGVKFIAVSIDDTRNMSKVGALVNGNGWEFDVYLDPNGDFKRKMHVNSTPHTFIVNGKNEIVWQHNSETTKEELYELIKKVAEGKEVK